MSKYHVNPTTGKVGVCSAEQACRFGAPPDQHFATPEAAREAYEASMANYSVPTPFAQEVEARRSEGSKWETLLGELDLESARDLYWTMRERESVLEDKAREGTLTPEEGEEWHQLDHDTLRMGEVWERKRVEQLAVLDRSEIAEQLASLRGSISELSEDFVRVRKANEKRKASKQEDLEPRRRALHELYTERNALEQVKRRFSEA